MGWSFRKKSTKEKVFKAVPEQLVRGVKLRLECRCTENILPKKVYLEISNAGQVRASTNDQGEETILTIIPVNVREVAIYHPATGHFLGMDAEGKLMASMEFTVETQFKENVYNNYYVVYSSLEYPTRTSKAARQGQEDTSMDAPEEWFISMKQLPVKSGIPKYRSVRGQKTKKRKAFCHFLPHAIEAVTVPKPIVEQDYSLVPRHSIVPDNDEIKQVKEIQSV